MSDDDNKTEILPVAPDPERVPDDDGGSGDEVPMARPPKQGIPCAAKGCLIALVVLTVLAMAGWYGVKHLFRKGMMEAAGQMREKFEQQIDAQDFTQPERDAIKLSVGRVFDRMESGELELEQAIDLVRNFSEGPLALLLMFKAFDKTYIEKSTLGDEEKVDFRRLQQRLLRGHVDKLIPQEDLEEIFNSIPKESVDGQDKIKDVLTDQEIRDLFELIRITVNNASVPDEEYGVNIPDEIDRAISEALD